MSSLELRRVLHEALKDLNVTRSSSLCNHKSHCGQEWSLEDFNFTDDIMFVASSRCDECRSMAIRTIHRQPTSILKEESKSFLFSPEGEKSSSSVETPKVNPEHLSWRFKDTESIQKTYDEIVTLLIRALNSGRIILLGEPLYDSKSFLVINGRLVIARCPSDLSERDRFIIRQYEEVIREHKDMLRGFN